MNRLLPFLKHAPIIKKHYNMFVSKDIISSDLRDYEGDDSRKPLLYLVRPLNVLVPAFNNKSKYYKDDEFLADIIEVEYSYVAQVVEITEDNRVLYPCVGENQWEEELVKDSQYIIKASNGVVLNSTLKVLSNSIISEVSANKFYEASLDDLMSMDLSSTPVSVNKQSPIQTRIESYLNGGYLTQRILLLVGPSAVAKSAQVKAVCKKYDYRMIDLRTSFMSRLDLQGLTEIIYNPDGSINSTSSPMEEFATCTDEYIKFCRDSIPVIESKIKEEETKEDNTKKVEDLKLILDRYKEGAKVPVLFLDEVSRTEASVRQALTNILSSKTFMGHKMSIARIVAADNYPIDSDEELQDIFLTKATEDSAYNDRFEAIPITPDDVLPSWKDWAVQSKGPDKQNIHPIIMDFLEQAEDNGENYYYDFSLVEQEYLQDMDDNKMSTSSYPNYRTWEFLSNYIYECQDKGMQVQYSTIYGFIGKDHAAIFWGWLQDNKIPLQVTTESEGDPEYENWDTIVEDAILTRTPTLLASPSGIGKSTRVNNIAKKLNAIVIEVNLSELDRSDVMGPPAKVSTIDRIGGQVEDVDEDLAKELQDLAGGFDLPSKITVRAPKLEIAKKFQEAIDSGRRVVLNFEELNRVTNPAVMSAVFEAISDNRIFGITFDPSQVSILACCNMGDNFQDTQSLDPAFAARFNIHKKDSYSEDDVESIRDYVKDNYNQYMNGFIESLDNDALIDMVSQVETRSIETSVASTRALYDLNLYLEDKNTTSLTYGTCLLTERKYDRMMGSLNKVKDYNDNIIQELVKAIKDGLNNWCALDTKTTVTLGNEKVSAREVKQLFEECIKHLDNGETQYFNTLKVIISSISVIDKECQSLREKTIGYIVGPDVSTKFCEYYNTVSGRGTVTIEIEDLKDFSLYPAYLDAKLKGIAQPEQIKSIILKSYTDILDFFTLSLSAEHYREFILKGMDRLITSDLRLELLTTLVSTTSYDEMVKKAEENNPDIAKNFLDQCGVNTSSIDLTQFVQGSKTQASSSKKPRFL